MVASACCGMRADTPAVQFIYFDKFNNHNQAFLLLYIACSPSTSLLIIPYILILSTIILCCKFNNINNL